MKELLQKLNITVLIVSIVAGIVVGMFAYKRIVLNTEILTITALGEPGENSSTGYQEVAIRTITFNGRNVKIAPIDGKWFWDDSNFYLWRPEHDNRQPAGVTRTVKFKIPVGTGRSVSFVSDIWRGKAAVMVERGVDTDFQQVVDTYSDGGGEKSFALNDSVLALTKRDAFQRAFLALAIGLVVLAGGYIALRALIRKKERTAEYKGIEIKFTGITEMIKTNWVALIVLSLSFSLPVSVILYHHSNAKLYDVIYLEALDEKNTTAESSVVVLLSIIVDGYESPINIIEGTWLRIDEHIDWVPWEAESLTTSVAIFFESVKNRSLIFKTNQWGGKARVYNEKFSEIIDLYSYGPDSKYEYVLPSAERGKIIQNRIIEIYIFLIVVLLSIIFWGLLMTVFKMPWYFPKIDKQTYSQNSKKTLWLDHAIWLFITNNPVPLFIICITVIGFLARLKGLPVHTEDMSIVISWCKTLKEHGIGNNILRDYTQPYLLALKLITYLPFSLKISIKALSIFFDLLCAIFAAILVKELRKEAENNFWSSFTYGIIWILPTVIFNGSYWGQSDSIYTAFLLLSAVMFSRRKYSLGFFAYAISISIKMTAIMYSPFLLLFYLTKKRFSIFNFFLLPLTFFGFTLPAVLAGKPFWQTINPLIHYGTDGVTGSLYNGYINFWALNSEVAADLILSLRSIMVLLCVGIIGTLIILLVFKKVRPNPSQYIGIAILFALIFIYLAPGMHERYFYAGDILSIVYFISGRDKRKWFVPIIINLHSFQSSIRYITGWVDTIDKATIVMLIAIVYCIFIIYFAKTLYCELTNKVPVLSDNQTDEYRKEN